MWPGGGGGGGEGGLAFMNCCTACKMDHIDGRYVDRGALSCIVPTEVVLLLLCAFFFFFSGLVFCRAAKKKNTTRVQRSGIRLFCFLQRDKRCAVIFCNGMLAGVEREGWGRGGGGGNH